MRGEHDLCERPVDFGFNGATGRNASFFVDIALVQAVIHFSLLITTNVRREVCEGFVVRFVARNPND